MPLFPLWHRSYRLSISAVRNPAAANSVQLAQLNLYSSLEPPQTPPKAISDATASFRSTTGKVDNTLSTAHNKGVETLLLLLANVVQHPKELKYRTLKCSNARVQSMLSCGDHFAALLKAIGEALHPVAALLAPEAPGMQLRSVYCVFTDVGTSSVVYWFPARLARLC